VNSFSKITFEKNKIYHATKELGMGKIKKIKKFKHRTAKKISHG
jgi:hypothetical protein